jgi:hypothetical protein
VTLSGHLPTDEGNEHSCEGFYFCGGWYGDILKKRFLSLRHWTGENGSHIFLIIWIMLDVGSQ